MDAPSRVVTIKHSGTAAMARLEAENWRGTRYTDFFVLGESETSGRSPARSSSPIHAHSPKS
ncbi:MAG: hypothetical protein JO105_17925 [Hyphomicrobiales bacterium]|nr:hypothetical protein [Hyphomicrobiales bacterium]